MHYRGVAAAIATPLTRRSRLLARHSFLGHAPTAPRDPRGHPTLPGVRPGVRPEVTLPPVSSVGVPGRRPRGASAGPGASCGARGGGEGRGGRRGRRNERQKLPRLHQVLPVLLQPLLLYTGHPPPRLRLLGPLRPAEFRRCAGFTTGQPEGLVLRVLWGRHRHDVPGIPGVPGSPQGGQTHAGAVFWDPAAALRCPDHSGHHHLHAACCPGYKGGRLCRGADPGVPGPGTSRRPTRELGCCPAAAWLLWLERTPGLGPPQ